MKDQFPGWNPRTDEELKSLWDDGTVAIDANVLLNAYRFSLSARESLLEALNRLGDQLWLPHRAAEEFHRNRLSLLIQQRICGERLDGELVSAEANLIGALGKQLRSLGRRDADAVSEAVEKQFKELRKQVKHLDREHQKGLGNEGDLRDDPLYERIVEIVGDRFGDAFGDEKSAEVREDAERRFKGQIPPALGDEDKDDERRDGDVIVWHQLIERAKDTGKPVIFVTDDQKDWMWEVKGKTVGPRAELVAEMAEQTGQAFHAYSTAQFVSVATADGEEVDAEVLEELEAPESGVWLYSQFAQELVSRGHDLPPGGLSIPREHPGVFASNALTSGFAVLVIHDERTTLAGQGLPLRCEVVDPNGAVYGRLAPPLTTHGQRPYRQSLVYPSEFPGAPAVISQGVHQVSWTVPGTPQGPWRDVFTYPDDVAYRN